MLADEDLTKGAESTLRLVGETIATIHQFYSRAFFSVIKLTLIQMLEVFNLEMIN